MCQRTRQTGRSRLPEGRLLSRTGCGMTDVTPINHIISHAGTGSADPGTPAGTVLAAGHPAGGGPVPGLERLLPGLVTS